MGKYLIIIAVLLFVGFILLCKLKKVEIEKHVIICLLGLLASFVWLFYPRDYHVKYEFLHSIHEMQSVEIVRFGHYDEIDNDIEPYTIKEGIDIEDFVVSLMNIECTRRRPSEAGIVPDSLEYGIKVIYTNGDYELIDDYGQAYYTEEEGFANDGIYKFNEAQFEFMIEYFLAGEYENSKHAF